AIAALDLIERDPGLIDRLWDNTRLFKAGLARLGFDTGASETPITPIMIGGEAEAMRFSDRLFEEGVFALGIAYPTVPRGKARVRTIVSAGHTPQDLTRALAICGAVGREMGVVR
ncbi:MAG TPA: aminotransferase class I/II-fold pyridoxal phosphate-dependent enzyme, partial [bacterium]|nr:aminotransferase class I/II-fold pyridoxal phosphate-dependent enzyme [bacterium]